jgi:hypothetical protein
MNDRARNYLDDLVKEVDEEIRESQPTNHDELRTHGQANADSAQDEQAAGVAQAPNERSNSASKGRGKKRPPKDKYPPDLVLRLPTIRSHAKAKVQKTVRFRPDVIAELDEHLESRLPGDERSFQDVMHEALELWLNANHRNQKN